MAKSRAIPEVSMRAVADLHPHPKNPRTHSDRQVAGLGAAFEEFGVLQFPVVDETGKILAGEGRWLAAKKSGPDHLPVIVVRGWTEEKKLAFMVSDNRWAMLGGFDEDKLRVAIGDLQLANFDLDLAGYTLDDVSALLAGDAAKSGAGSLAKKFGVPPFTVLNAREGWWQDRKQAWIALGIESELGRGAAPGGSLMPVVNRATGKIARSDSRARAIPGTDAKRTAANG